MLTTVAFAYTFVWPLVLPLVCLAAICVVERRHLFEIALALILFVALTGLPMLMWSKCEYCGLARASLSLYPLSIAAIGVALIARLAFRWWQASHP